MDFSYFTKTTSNMHGYILLKQPAIWHGNKVNFEILTQCST